MSTRSIIARKINDTEYETVYCHWDGYLENNGLILECCYNSPEKVKDLISHGNMSSLGKNLSECDFYKENPEIVDTKKGLYEKASFADFIYLHDGKDWTVSKFDYSLYASKRYDNSSFDNEPGYFFTCFKPLKKELEKVREEMGDEDWFERIEHLGIELQEEEKRTAQVRKIKFNAEEMANKMDKHCWNGDMFYDYSSLCDVVDESLKRDGINSEYLNLVEQINKCNKYKNYYLVNTQKNGIREMDDAEFLDEFLDNSCYKDAMKDPEFATDFYSYIHARFCKISYFANRNFKQFTNLRKGKGDAVDLNSLNKELGVDKELSEERER